MAKYDYLLVEFYESDCDHCKAFAPDYERAALLLSELDPPMTLAKVDSIHEKDLTERFNVEEFPTLFWFNHGSEQAFGGKLTTESVV